MNTGTRKIDLSLIPNNIAPRIYVSQYDVGVTLTFDWSGTLAAAGKAQVMGTKPSGIGFALDCTKVGSGTNVTGFTVNTTLDMTSEYGDIPAEIRITEGTTVVGSQNFILVVEESPHKDGTIDGYEEGRTIFEKMSGLIDDATTSASEAAASATSAGQSASAAAQSATNASTSATNAAKSASQAMSTTPSGYNDFVANITANENAGYLRKNILPAYAQSGTQNGITFTVNADNSITVNGTNTGVALARFINNNGPMDLSGQRMILSGCPAGGSPTTYALRVYEQGTGKEYDTGSGVTFTGANNNYIGIYIAAGATLNNVTFYPMVRPASISDQTYVPYTPPSFIKNGAFTPASGSNVSENATTLKQEGNVVNFRGYITLSSAPTAGQAITIGALSGVDLPTNGNVRTIIGCGANAQSTNDFCYATIAYNGNFTIAPKGSYRVYYFDITYIV